MNSRSTLRVGRACLATLTGLLGGLLLSSVAQAQPRGYFGVSVGQGDSTVDRAGIRTISGPAAVITADESDDALRLFGGMGFNKYFGFEIGFSDLGTATATANNFGSIDRSLQILGQRA